MNNSKKWQTAGLLIMVGGWLLNRVADFVGSKQMECAIREEVSRQLEEQTKKEEEEP